ncbi:MAG: alanine racemase [Gammaproteobacteria bacterium]|nr:MAG: alanine racemase [Gammaproteobacteria bacterium]
MSGHRNYLEINVSALEHNLKAIKSKVAGDCQFMGIVKGNAWGAGTSECARSFVNSGVDWIGVTTVEDAVLVRQEFGIPILIICEPPRGKIPNAVSLNISITVYSIESARLISKAATELGCNASIHIKINTGLNRVGISPENAVSFFNEIVQLENLEVTGLFSHFASADDLYSNEEACRELAYIRTRRELGLFKQAVYEIKNQSNWSGIIHMANTGATLFLPESHLDMVRVSTGLMGLCINDPIAAVVDLKQVYSWKSEICHFINVHKGEGVGYSSSYKCPTDTTIATLPIGWGDGFPRAFLNGGHVMIRGSFYPIVAMSMDMTTIDLGEKGDDMVIGEEVIIFGEQLGKILEPMAQGERVGMGGSDAMLAVISERVPRVYV